MKMRNLVKEKLAANGYVLGAFVASGSAINAEILGLNNFDFIIIDMEHAQTGSETIVEMVRASEMYEMAPFVRVYDPADGPMMSRMLDVGVHGLMIPMVETHEQAKYIINSVKIPPLGKRGMGGGRGPRWGLYEDYNKGECNDNLYTIMQCETREGVKNIEAICKTPGLDCIFIGTSDLSQDYGCFGDLNNPELVDAIDKVLKACQSNNITPGIFTATSEAALMRIRQGFKVVTVMNDLGFFRNQSKKYIETVRNGVAE